VVLQQPRHNHPFEKGLSAVIEDCETLYALDDVFSAVSCDSLSIRTHITVVDLLPYISGDLESIDDETLRESFRASAQVILEKEPSVLLCAGKIWLPNRRRFDDRKGDAWKFESIGIGKKFGITSKFPNPLKIRHGGKGFMAIPRLNGFHPSYAMNHHPHASILRQLQILIGVETCATLRGDWEEEGWMDQLRGRCQAFSRAQSGKREVSYPKVSLVCITNLLLTLFFNQSRWANVLSRRTLVKAQPDATVLNICQTTKISTLRN
jgi:hypothetical protein